MHPHETLRSQKEMQVGVSPRPAFVRSYYHPSYRLFTPSRLCRVVPGCADDSIIPHRTSHYIVTPERTNRAVYWRELGILARNVQNSRSADGGVTPNSRIQNHHERPQRHASIRSSTFQALIMQSWARTPARILVDSCNHYTVVYNDGAEGRLQVRGRRDAPTPSPPILAAIAVGRRVKGSWGRWRGPWGSQRR